MISMDLLALPEDVFYSNLLPFLKLNHLMRLRRVCRQTKIYSDGYIRMHCTDREIEINDRECRTFPDYNNMNLPCSRIHLRNQSGSGLDIFQHPAIPEFLQFHAAKLTHLTVAIFATCHSTAESNFYSALTNLRYLDIDTILLDPMDTSSVQNSSESTFTFPAVFKNLKSLKVLDVQCPAGDGHIQNYIKALLEFCQNLEFFRHPCYNGEPAPAESIAWIHDYFEMREQQFPDGCPLKFYDFQNVYQCHSLVSLSIAVPFLQFCHTFNVKLLNMDSYFVDQLSSFHADLFPEEDNAAWRTNFYSTILSFINFSKSMSSVEIPFMKKITIENTSGCTIGPGLAVENVPKWPNLKKLELRIDSEEMEMEESDGETVERKRTVELLQILFGSVQREALQALTIIYSRKETILPCPRAQDIVRTCGNVSTLHLVNWQGSNEEVSRFWEGLLNLEEVILVGCTKIGNAAFLGENNQEPAFLKLTKLRRFFLGELDQTPTITDLAFELVFCHLKTKRFCLRSENPIQSVTIKGIRALVSGEFNNHVESFPFHCWSLANVSDKEFAQLKSEFRASHML